MNIGLIGLGYWGNNIKKSLAKTTGRLITVCDSKFDTHHEDTNEVLNTPILNHILEDKLIDLVCIATPPKTHYALVEACLEAGKHVFCEKPFTLTSKEAWKLVDLANKKKLRIFNDFTFLFSWEVRKMKELLNLGIYGKVIRAHSIRKNFGPHSKEVDVIFDLAPHCLSIFNHLLGWPSYVSATGSCWKTPKIYDDAMINFLYNKGIIARSEVSWNSTTKERYLKITTELGELVSNFCGDVSFLFFDAKDSHFYTNHNEIALTPLELILQNSIFCIENNKDSVSNENTASWIVTALEQAQVSCLNNGHEQSLALHD